MRTLEVGDTGEEVRLLQAVLGLPPDGNFSVFTEETVRAFQAAFSLPVNGVVESRTWKKLGELSPFEIQGAIMSNEKKPLKPSKPKPELKPEQPNATLDIVTSGPVIVTINGKVARG